MRIGGAERSGQHVVAERDRLAQECRRVVASQRGLREHRTERFAAKQRFVAVLGIEVRHERARIAAAGCGDRLGCCMTGGDLLLAPDRAGIVRRSRRRVAERAAHLLQEARRKIPGLRGDQHLRGDAVRTRVVELHRRDVGSLESEVGFAPRTGNHDHRRDVAQLAGDRLVEHRPCRRLACGGVGTGAEHDRVVGALAAGQVDRLDRRVRAEIRTDVRTAVDDANEAFLDQRREDAREDRRAGTR